MRRILLCLMLCLLMNTVVSAEALYPAKGDNGLWGYINAQAEWVISPQFDGVGCFRGDYAEAWMIPADVDPDEWYDMDCTGIINRAGAWVLPPEYSLHGGQSGEWFGGKDMGIWLVTQWGSGNDLEGFFDIPTGTFSGLKWGYVWHWCSDSRLIPVTDATTHKSGYADRSTGELVIPCLYYSVDPANFYEGVASVALSDEEGWETSPWHLINEQEETIPLPEGYQSDYANHYSHGRIAVVSPEGLWGYADRTGAIVIPAQFAEAEPFSEDIAAVVFPEGDHGYIDTAGNIIARRFSWGGDFWNGYAKVSLAGETRYIRPDGSIIPFMDHDRFYPISEGRIWMRTAKGYEAPWHLLDGEGDVLTAEPYMLPEFESASFPEGLQAVRNAERKWGYIDLNGEVAIPFIYDAAYPFEDGLAEVWIGNRGGYIDKSGREIYMWEEAE